jgi:hypothetical protein
MKVGFRSGSQTAEHALVALATVRRSSDATCGVGPWDVDYVRYKDGLGRRMLTEVLNKFLELYNTKEYFFYSQLPPS